jgi:hypothetical protein
VSFGVALAGLNASLIHALDGTGDSRAAGLVGAKSR